MDLGLSKWWLSELKTQGQMQAALLHVSAADQPHEAAEDLVWGGSPIDNSKTFFMLLQQDRIAHTEVEDAN